MPRPLCRSLCTMLIAGTMAVATTLPAAADQPSQTASAPAAGERDLGLGREAVSRQDYAAAIPALRRAVAALDPQRDRAAFADAWLQLGLAYLLGPGSDPEQALAAFLASAAAAPNPASAYLWAGTAAERLGRHEEAETFKARALAGPAPTPEPQPEIAPEPAAAPLVPLPEPAPSAPVETLPEPAPPAPAEALPPAVPEPVDAPAPEAAPQAAPAEGEAFRHFFSRREPQPAPPPTQTKTAPPAPEQGKEVGAETKTKKRGDGATGDDGKDRKEREAGEAKAAEPASGAAFDHFFRRRRGAKEGTASQSENSEEEQPAEAKPTSEKPPAF